MPLFHNCDMQEVFKAYNRAHTGDVLKDGRHYFRFRDEIWFVPAVSLRGKAFDVMEATPISEEENTLTLAQIETVCRELETLLSGDDDFPRLLRRAIETLEHYRQACPEDWRGEDDDFLACLRTQLRKFEGQGSPSAPV